MEDEKTLKEDQLKDLIEISRYYGNNSEYVIAGGGNTSFKNDKEIWIKASGTSLSDIDNDGFVCLSRDSLNKMSSKSYSRNPVLRESQVKLDLERAILYPENKRPSVETSMHEIIDYKYVVHTHPTLVNALMCSRKAKILTRKIFGRQTLFIPYTDPGYILYKRVESEILLYRNKHQKDPSVIFLQNHGVFVSANNLQEIKDIYLDIEQKLKAKLEIHLPEEKSGKSVEYAKRLAQKLSDQLEIDQSCVTFRNNDLVKHFTIDKAAFEKIDRPFTPDDIVYCKSIYLYTKSEFSDLAKEINTFTERHGFRPKVIAVQDKGIFAVDENEKSAAVVMEIFQNMMKVSYLSENFGGPQFMTPEQIDFIDNWEVENYRRQMTSDE